MKVAIIGAEEWAKLVAMSGARPIRIQLAQALFPHEVEIVDCDDGSVELRVDSTVNGLAGRFGLDALRMAEMKVERVTPGRPDYLRHDPTKKHGRRR